MLHREDDQKTGPDKHCWKPGDAICCYIAVSDILKNPKADKLNYNKSLGN